MADLETLRGQIRGVLDANGAMLGKELLEALPGAAYLPIWQACFSAHDIQISHFSRYYLRYDITREDHVRLSPSILRDFLSFTLFSLPGQREAVIERQVELSNLHREISVYKIKIARTIIADILAEVPLQERDKLCAFIAGDLVYFLGHAEPREVKASGERVRGSDIDIVIVSDGASEETVAEIDRKMLQAKSFYLRHPAHRQEVDYIVKPIEKTFRQFAYRDIHDKIASKIVFESLFLAGSVALFSRIKDELVASGAKELIEADFDAGLKDRKLAMRTLLNADPDTLDANTESLFFFSQERVEFT